MTAINTYKKVNEFLGDIVTAVKDTPWPSVLANLMPWSNVKVDGLPWAGVLGEAAADTVAPVKFVYKLYELATEIKDQDELGKIACTFAFQKSVEEALKSNLLELSGNAGVSIDWPSDTGDKQYDFSTMRLESTKEHPFYRDSETQFSKFCDAMNWSVDRKNKYISQVRARFSKNLRVAITHKDGAEKFKSFRSLIQLPDPDAHIRALQQHADYQTWKFEEARVLNTEPFALQHIYVDSDCGELEFAELQQVDPFDEENGGRQSLMDTTLKLLADETFRDAVVVQGCAGSGKSTFTLRLCQELQDRGVSPIRIELKKIDASSANRDIVEILAEAVRLADDEFNPHRLSAYGYSNDLFDKNSIFNQSVKFEFGANRTTISQYVLILDAWDEISVGAEEGYQQLVERLLSQVRRTYLSTGDRAFPVRVVLCGRPSEAITTGSGFPINDTRLLTVRPFTPNQCEEFATKLASALENCPIEPADDWPRWEMPTYKKMKQVFIHYESQLGANSQSDVSLEVLGMPLLSLLAFRLMAEWGDSSLINLFENTTLLYRCLVDRLLQGAKPSGTTDGQPEAAHIRGNKLRNLLRDTAEFISVLGEESIAREELLHRLEEKSDGAEAELSDLIEKLGDEVYTRLMISFFFKPSSGTNENRNLGCEFTHKSFREYLFAEQIVEALKEFGRGLETVPPLNLDKYWLDFPENDPRRHFSRRLLHLLGPQRLSHEVAEKLSQQIEWEITRTFETDPYPKFDGATEPLRGTQWERVRDGLADVWSWWAEGVPLRPVVQKKDSGNWDFDKPLMSVIAARCRKLSQPIKHARPIRLITVDSHFGDSLFQICADVHQNIIRNQLSPLKVQCLDWDLKEFQSVSKNPYQAKVSIKSDVHPDQKITAFAPGSSLKLRKMLQLPELTTYFDRINGSGFRHVKRSGKFPSGISFKFLCVEGVFFSPARALNFYGATLAYSTFDGGVFDGGNFNCADLTRVHFRRALLVDTSFQNSIMRGFHIADCAGSSPSFRSATMDGSVVQNSEFDDADFGSVSLVKSEFLGTEINNGSFVSAKMDGVKVSDSTLRNANFKGAVLTNSCFRNVDLSGAILLCADLSNATFENVNLDNVEINEETKWTGVKIDSSVLTSVIYKDKDGSINDELKEQLLDSLSKQ